MDLNGVLRNDNGDVDGYLEYTMRHTPLLSPLRKKIGQSAKEFVSGKFNSNNGQLTLDGKSVSDASMLACDSYRVDLNLERGSFTGQSRGLKHKWDGHLSGTVHVERSG